MFNELFTISNEVRPKAGRLSITPFYHIQMQFTGKESIARNIFCQTIVLKRKMINLIK